MAPVPFGLKLCFSVSPKAICLTVSVPFEALAVGELEPEPEPEPELEHPAVPSRPTATTVAPSHVAVRKLKIFTKRLYAIRVTHGAAELEVQVNGPRREDGQNLKVWSTDR